MAKSLLSQSNRRVRRKTFPARLTFALLLLSGCKTQENSSETLVGGPDTPQQATKIAFVVSKAYAPSRTSQITHQNAIRANRNGHQACFIWDLPQNKRVTHEAWVLGQTGGKGSLCLLTVKDSENKAYFIRSAVLGGKTKCPEAGKQIDITRTPHQEVRVGQFSTDSSGDYTAGVYLFPTLKEAGLGVVALSINRIGGESYEFTFQPETKVDLRDGKLSIKDCREGVETHWFAPQT